MADTCTECSMCGDVGFPDKLFHCIRCRSRYQHSYCSNYSEEEPGVCDWCLSAERSHGGGGTSKKPDSSQQGKRSEYSPEGGDRVKRGGDRDDSGPTSRGKNPSKPAGRRYKLLKDVLC